MKCRVIEGGKGAEWVTEEMRYPIGKCDLHREFSEERKESWIGQIAATPAKLREAVSGLSEEQLNTPYRPGGWTIRQVVHHIPDSHMNSYIRFKLALTENQPTIKTYQEDKWAELADSQTTPIETSLNLLDSLHARWVNLLRSMDTRDFERSMTHPDLGPHSLFTALGIYAWHGRHHVAHITALSARNGWNR